MSGFTSCSWPCIYRRGVLIGLMSKHVLSSMLPSQFTFTQQREMSFFFQYIDKHLHMKTRLFTSPSQNLTMPAAGATR